MKTKHILIIVAVLLAVSPLLGLLLDKWVDYWRIATNLGDEPAYIALTILLFYLVDPYLGVNVLIALSTGAWLDVFMKNLFKLPRPPRELRLAPAEGYGFPSGHATTSTTFWTSLSLETRRREVYLLGAVTVAIVCLSRIILNVHYPVDVAGGVVLGLFSSFSVYYATRKITLKPWLASLALALYGVAVSVLTFVQGDLNFVRLGGLLVGLAVYPLIREKINLRKESLLTKTFLALVALVLAFGFTQVAKSQAPLAQFILYLATGFITVSLPLLRSKSGRKTTG